jgi:hypothetical protein
VPKKPNESSVLSENEPWLKQPASTIPTLLPTKTRQQTLPYGDLTWENFERLCLRLAELEGEAEYWALYGTKGQAQDGIDIYVRHDGGKTYSVWQSKRHKTVTTGTIRNAIKYFLDGRWMSKSSSFYICFQADIQDIKVQDELETQSILLGQKGIRLIPLGAIEMSRRLKSHPEVVDDFFGREWTVEFCGEDSATTLGNRLNAADVARLRKELLTLYSSHFSSIDPGIVSAFPLGQQHQLSLLNRFIEPDVTFEDTSNTFTHRPARPDGGEVREVSSDIASGKPEQREFSTRPTMTSTVRRSLANWLTEVEQAAIIAAAGYGKSSFLRALALDLLSDGNLFPDLTKRWGDRIPIVLPFASWTHLISNGSEFSLANAIYSFYKRFHISNDLLSLLDASLKDNRLLLLIDGLDEWTSKDAARTALTLLDTFVKTHSIISVVTTRPGGIAKLGTLDPMWKCGNLAPLSDDQQRRLASIWFSYLRTGTSRNDDRQTRDSAIARDVQGFFDDLSGRGTLMPLAGVPLLLSGLISLAVRNVVLPRNRFQAYSELIRLLLDEHPNRRAAASMPTVARSPVLSDSALVRRVLSAFAYHNRMNNVGSGTSYTDARKVAVEYLQSMDGAGLEPAEAIRAANDLLTVDAETTGLLVQKAPDEIGFLHGVFEEYLAGLFAASLDIEAQKLLIGERIGDPKWTSVLLSMLHNVPRPSEVESLVRVALSASDDQSHAKLSLQLAAEVAFGDFRCPPKYALKIAADVFSTIETGPWPQERQTLLNIALDSGTAGPLSEPLRRKLAVWMPDVANYRSNVYGAMAEWKASSELIDCLWHGLFSEDFENRKMAGRSLVLVSQKNQGVGERLFNLLCTPIDGEIAASALLTLFYGWPTFPGLRSVIAQAKESSLPVLQVTAVLCAVRSGAAQDEDLERLLPLAEPRSFLSSSYSNEIAQALIEGWPSSDKLFEMAIGSCATGPERRLDSEVAKAYVVATSHLSPQRDTALANVIREDRFFFSHIGGFNLGPANPGPEVLAAIDDHLARMEKFRGNDIANLAIRIKSRRAKDRLIELLDDQQQGQFIFWPVWGLLSGWGMKDPEVRAALEPLAALSPVRVQYFSHYLADILPNKAHCREILLNIARLPDLRRLDFLAAAFRKAGSDHHDEEVVAALLNHDMSLRGVFDSGGSLIAGFGKHPKVRALALARICEIDAPWSSLAAAYGDDEEFRPIIISRLLSISAELRSTIATKAARSGNTDSALYNCVRQFALETNGTVKTLAVTSLCETIKLNDIDSGSVLDQLRRDVEAIGPLMDPTRQAAIAGLVALKRLDIFRDLREEHNSQPLDVALYFPENRILIAYLARNWSYVKSVFGDSSFERISRHGGNHWYAWDHFASYVGESEALRDEFISYCAQEAKTLSSSGLEALSRVQPRSHLLLEHCLRAIDRKSVEDTNSSPLDRTRRALVVGQILGRQFSDRREICVTLEQRVHLHDCASVVGLSLGWPSSGALGEIYDDIRQNGWVGQQVIWASALQIANAIGSTEEFKYLLEFILSNGTGDVWEFLDFCAPVVTARLKKDDDLTSYYLEKLRTDPTNDPKASLPSLLVSSIGLSDELKELCETSYADQCARGQLSESGLDIVAARIRPVAHSLLDVLVPRTN